MRFIRSFFFALESGRTMLEMLAVIVIVGVLTIGGFKATDIANRLFRENQIYTEVETLIQGIIDTYSWARDYSDLNERAVCDNEMVANICVGENKLQNVFGGAITVHSADSGQTFLIKYQNVPITIANKLQEKSWRTARYVSDTCDDSSSTCTVVFGPEDGSDYGTQEGPYSPSEDVPCSLSADCDTANCEICDDGVCVYGCSGDEICIGATCRTPICTTHADCSGNSTAKFCNINNDPAQNTCVECLRNTHCDENACLHCVNGSCVYKCEPGQVCSNGSCTLAACQSDSECLLRNAKLPYCYEVVPGDSFYNKCVACTDDIHCDEINCYACKDQSCVYQCASGEVCRSGSCELPACQQDSDCTSSDKPYCKQFAYADNNICVACYKDEQCDYENCYGCVDDTTCAYKCDNDTQWCDRGRCRDNDDTETDVYETTGLQTTVYETSLETTNTVYETTAYETTACFGFWSADGICYPCDYVGDVTISSSEKAACRACGRRVEGNVCLNEKTTECSSNDDCKGQDFTSTYYCNVYENGSTGTCEPVDAITAHVNGTTYLTKYTAMTYAGMQNFCDAARANPVGLSEFDCAYDFAGEMVGRGYCNAPYVDTDGNTIYTDISSGRTRSQAMQAFMESDLRSGEYWTGTTFSGSGSYAYVALPSSGYIAAKSKTATSYPLCQ